MLKGVVVVGELELFDGVVAYFVEDAVEVNRDARWRLLPVVSVEDVDSFVDGQR